MAYVSTISVTQSSITVDIKGLSARQNTYNGFRFRINSGPWVSVSVDSGYTGYDSPNYTFTGLSPGTSYHIEGATLTNSWYSVDPKYASTEAAPQTATPTGFSMSATSSSEIKFSWNGVSGATAYEIAIYSPFSDSRQVSSSPAYWGYLSANTTYYGYVRAYSPSGGWSGWSSYSTTTTLKGRPGNFEWDWSKTSGTSFNISANEWNRLMNKINEFRDFKYLSYYSYTSAHSSYAFTASQYNEARNAIYSMNTSIPSYRNTGDIIYASEINALRNALNAIY